jgi:vitamin B12 transporter
VRRDSTDDRPDSPGDTLGVYAYESRADYARVAADLRADARVAPGVTVSVGGTVEDQRERSRNSYQSAFGPGSGAADVSRTNRALYGQLAAAGERVGVQAGVRLDDNQAFGSFVTWRAGLSVRVADGTRLRANAGTAFKEPTFVENYAQGFAVGNPTLVPERSQSVEAGVEQALAGGRIRLAATAFTQRFSDLIQYTFATAQPTDPNFYNVAAATASGAELELEALPVSAVRVVAQYTYLRTAASDSGFDGTVFAPDRRLVRRPTHSGSIAAEWQGARATLGARLLAVGARDDLDFNAFPAQRTTLPAYGRLDLWLRAGLTPALALTGRVDNATDARYAEIAGFPAPGRRLLVGASLGAGR